MDLAFIPETSVELEVLEESNTEVPLNEIKVQKDNPLLALLPKDFDDNKPLAIKTWSYKPVQWKLDNGDIFAELGQLNISLIRIPIVNLNKYRLYSTLYRTVTSKGWRTKPLGGGRFPTQGFLIFQINFVDKNGGYIDGWTHNDFLYCNDNQRVINPTSRNFNSDFFFDVTTAPQSYRSATKLVRC